MWFDPVTYVGLHKAAVPRIIRLHHTRLLLPPTTPQIHKDNHTNTKYRNTNIQIHKYTNTQGSLAKVHHTGLLEAQILKAAEILNNKLILCAVTSQHTRQINILE